MKIDRPLIVARKSLWPYITAWQVIVWIVTLAFAALTFFVISPNELLTWELVVIGVAGLVTAMAIGNIIWTKIDLSYDIVEFYPDFVVKKTGVFNKIEDKCMFPKIISCNVERTFSGIIFNYGNIQVDTIGKWDIDLIHIKRPMLIRRHLEKHFISAQEIRAMRQTVITQ